jgi:hypothetical protein
LYAKLAAHHVDSERAIELIKTRKPDQIDAWLDYIRRANTPGSGMKPVANPGGFLVKMLDHPENYPRSKKEMPITPEEKYLSGPLASELNH